MPDIPGASRSGTLSAINTGADFSVRDCFLLGDSPCRDVCDRFLIAFLGIGSLAAVAEVEPLSEAAAGDRWPGGDLDLGSETGLRDFSFMRSFSWRSLAFLVLPVSFMQCGHF